MKRKFNLILMLLKVFADALAVYFSFIFAYLLRFNFSIIPVTKGIPSISVYIQTMPAVIIVFLAVFKWGKFYEEHKIIYKTDEFLNIVRAVTVAIIITIALTFVYREYSYSRVVIGYSYILNIIFIYLLHRILRLLRIKLLVPFSGKFGILVIGGQKVKRTLLKNISKHHGEFNVYFMPDIEIPRVREFISHMGVQEVVIADSSLNREKIMKLINLCEKMDIEFKMVPDMLELKMGEMSFDKYFGVPVLELKHPLFEPSNYYFKRTYDILLSMIILTILSPFLTLVMIGIKLDSLGPIIYSHLRKGYKGRSFFFFKFRSMVNDADMRLKDIIKHSERIGPVFKMRKDPRVTRAGKFLRKYSIDEIPQLFNVLKGDMSLVGPRPQVLWETAVYNEEAKRRLNILPGITGLWQISGRSDLSYEEMIRLDLYYLENWTPGFDIKILIKTLPVVLLRKGAY